MPMQIPACLLLSDERTRPKCDKSKRSARDLQKGSYQNATSSIIEMKREVRRQLAERQPLGAGCL
jgi:hypothetical protein